MIKKYMNVYSKWDINTPRFEYDDILNKIQVLGLGKFNHRHEESFLEAKKSRSLI